MSPFARIIPALGCALLALLCAAHAAEKKVLFLGGPVQQAIVTAAAKELKGKVQLRSAGFDANDSGSALANFDKLIGGEKWDLIYFNFGIGDLFYKDPKTREIRAMSKNSGGVRVSTPEQYEKNLEQLVQRLMKTDAKLLWGCTTPLVTVDFFPSFKGNLFEANSEVEYNEIAAKVMKRHGVPVVDLHAYVMKYFKEGEKHPAYSKYDQEMTKKGHPLHEPLVTAILSSLR